jgi:predicted XRE-type DNA-binding protein
MKDPEFRAEYDTLEDEFALASALIRARGDVFADMGFSPEEAEELNVKSSLIAAIHDTVAARKLTQKAAAQICGTDQPTLSKIVRGRMESVTINRLAAWLTALGLTVEIHSLRRSCGQRRGRRHAVKSTSP